MINEIIFLLQSIVMGLFALLCLHIGPIGLTCFVSITCLLANLFVVKQVLLCGYTATASDAYSIGAVFGLNLLQEYYGRTSAQHTINISFMLLIFYCIVSQLHLAFDPCMVDTAQVHYQAILGWMPRIVAASLSVYLIVQYIDAWLYSTLKRLCRGNYLVARNIVCLTLCQLLDTILFSFLGLYGILHNLGDIIIVSYCIKLVAIGISIPFIIFSKKIFSRPKS